MNSLLVLFTILLSHQLLASPVAEQTPPSDNQTIVIEKECGKQYFHATQQFIYVYNNASKPNNAFLSCEKDKNVTAPKDYTVTPGVGAHKYHTESKNWNDARNMCIKEGAHLAVVNSKEEENLFVKVLAEKKSSWAWIGLHCQFKLHDWVTVEDQPLVDVGYLRWNPNEPNNVASKEFCVEIRNTGGLNDENCNSGRPFICEFDLTS